MGRDCDTTSCPTQQSTTVITSNGMTIVAGASDVATLTSGGASTTSQGNCQSGWATCAASDGGGCCPSGFACGASCTATISGQSNVGKEAPSSATRISGLGWSFIVFDIAIVMAAGLM